MEVLCWIDRVWSFNEYACFACNPSVHLNDPSIGFVYVFVCRKLSPHLRDGSQVLALLMLFLCVILHTMSSGKSLQLICILSFVILCLSAINMMFVNIMLLANIVPNPIKDTDKGISYRPISLLSVISDTGEEPSSLHNSKHTKHTHATRVQNTTLYNDGTTH